MVSLYPIRKIEYSGDYTAKISLLSLFSMSCSNKVYTIGVFGPKGVGKTSWVQAICNSPSRDVRVKCTTNNHRTVLAFDIYDENYDRTKFNCILLMFDVTDPGTFECSKGILEDLKNTGTTSPIILVGNKVEARGRKVLPKEIYAFIKEQPKNITYMDISTKSGYHLDRPLQHLGRIVTGNCNLRIRETTLRE